MDGWRVLLVANSESNPSQTLSSKRGDCRIFKVSDTAIQWCKEIGFQNITIQFNTLNSEAQPPAAAATVLLIEDNPDDIELTRRAFANTDLDVTLEIAKDGQEGLDYIFAKNKYSNRNIKDLPKLILLDINLPKLSGLEVLKEIRENETTKYVPVVLLTTSDEFCDIAEGYQLGSNSYIKKPVSFNIFSEVIQNLGQYWLHINTSPPTLEKA
ncbi:MAG: response regulator [Gammaproteobacteria bacterium]|nr:response regulator [Gammaproteobacteria bacterium]